MVSQSERHKTLHSYITEQTTESTGPDKWPPQIAIALRLLAFWVPMLGRSGAAEMDRQAPV